MLCHNYFRFLENALFGIYYYIVLFSDELPTVIEISNKNFFKYFLLLHFYGAARISNLFNMFGPPYT